MKIESKTRSLFIQVILWIVVYAAFILLDSDHYLFGWIIHNKAMYIGLGLAVVLITYFSKKVGFFLSLGNISGLLLGRFLGDFLQTQSILKIREGMTEGEIYGLRSHKGVYIWIFSIIISLIISLIIEKQDNKLK